MKTSTNFSCRSILLRMKILQIKVVENFKTHFVTNICLLENCATYEVMWGKKWYSRTARRWQYNNVHAHCTLGM